MRTALKRHPDSFCAAVAGIDAEVRRHAPGGMMLRFVVTGRLVALRAPPPDSPGRADGLWRHTCFEAFLRAPSGEAYYEFNFSPSRQWAAYRFDGYRRGMAPAEGLEPPRINVTADEQRLELTAALALRRVPDLPRGSAWRVALSAVIEETAGGLSYWALAHPPGEPDFHHSDCFALELPAAWPA